MPVDYVEAVDSNRLIIDAEKGTAIITAIISNKLKAICTVNVTKPDPSLKFTKKPYISTYYFNPKPSCKFR